MTRPDTRDATESFAPFAGRSEDAKARLHAQLAERLIAACGGVLEIVQHNACRVGRSQLFGYMQPHIAGTMPADVIADLEQYCGTPIYSRALVEDRPHTPEEVAGVAAEACDVGEAAVDLQRLARLATADGELTPREKEELETGVRKLKDQVRELEAAIDRGRA